MKSFTEPLLGLKEYVELKTQLKKGKKEVLQVSGCIDAQKPHFMYSLLQEGERHFGDLPRAECEGIL